MPFISEAKQKKPSEFLFGLRENFNKNTKKMKKFKGSKPKKLILLYFTMKMKFHQWDPPNF